jgi:hypothetical protein
LRWTSRSGLFSPQAAPRQCTQEVRPNRLRLGGPDLHAQDLASPVRIDADGDDDRHGDDTAAPPDLQIGGVDPQVGPVAFDRPVEEGLDLAVDLFAQP